MPSPDHTPEQHAVQQSEAQRLAGLLATLSPRERELMRSGNMSNDAWLHALRGDPSPVFTEQLPTRLRAQDPAPETRREWWPRQALVAAVTVIVMAC